MLARTRKRFGIASATLVAAALTLLLAVPAQAAPTHVRHEALDVTGLNHACGAAVDSQGDLYLASAGESKVNVYDPSHNFLTSIEDNNTPCGLAVTTTGVLYVSEKAKGEVVRFKPNAYPFVGTPTYGSREVIDASTKAKGIAVDPFDNRLYVAEGSRVSAYDAEGNLGINEVQRIRLLEATGGTFKLKFGGQETSAIPFNAKAGEVKAALEALSSIGAGNVSVTSPKEGEEFFITFTGALGRTDTEAIAGDTSGLTGSIFIEEKVKGWSGHIGEGVLSEASGVAPYSAESESTKTDRYLAVADAAGLEPDRLDLFGGQDIRAVNLHGKLTGTTTPDGSFGFGAAGAYLAADPGTIKAKKCATVGEEACTAGHLYLYDAAHKALDEFDGSGEYLDRATSAAFADAEPTAIAIDRSGGANDGTIYVTAGAGTGGEALAFRPLLQPSRKPLKKPSEETGGRSQEFKNAIAVATDSFGDVYAAAGSKLHVYDPKEGKEITSFTDAGGPTDLAVDSTGKVYVLDGEKEVTYYTPSAYPPVTGTTYTRHTPAVVLGTEFPVGNKSLKGIAVNPGPVSGKDHLFVTSPGVTREYDSAANSSKLLNSEFAKGISVFRQSIAVNGANGNIYFGGSPNLIFVINPAGTEVLARIDTTVSATGSTGSNPLVAIDQASGHVVEFDGVRKSAHEYDAVTGGFVAEFGNFTEGLVKLYRVAADNACAVHEPRLTGKACEEFDPANGNVYVAFDDTSESHPPYDVTAFGPLNYKEVPPPPKFKLTVKETGTGSGKVTTPDLRHEEHIDCQPTCLAEFEEGTEVTLSASAAEGSKFNGWSGSGCTGTGTCKVTMSEAKEVTAEFESTETEKFPLEVIIEGPGSGEVKSLSVGIVCPPTCSAEVFKGTKVTLEAKEDTGSKFFNWSGCDSEPAFAKCEVMITKLTKVTATFDFATYPLTVIKEGSGEGTVTSDPVGINCGSDCTHEYKVDTEVELGQSTSEGSEFLGWGGACSGTEPTEPCKVKVTEAEEVTATFAALPQAIAKPPHPIAYTEATLRGEVDTAELETEYRFEYLTQTQFEEEGESFEGAQHTPEGELEPAKDPVPVQAHLGSLKEGTAYRFRLLVANTSGKAEDEGTFETLERRPPQSCLNGEYRTGLSANLPDCRAYELVTPAQTDGLSPRADLQGLADSFSNWLTVQRGEAAGERLSYFTSGTLPGFEGNGQLDGYRAERGVGAHPVTGWQSALFSPSFLQTSNGQAQQHGIASDQLYSLWEASPPLATFPETLPKGIYLRTPAGFEALGQGSLGADPDARGRYLSAGGTHAIFSSKAHLEPEAPPKEDAALYDRPASSSSTHVLTLPPGSGPEEEAEFDAALRSKEQAAYQGASEDGSTVAFKAGVGLYARLDDASTERVSPRTARVGDELSCAEGPQQGVEQANRHFQWLRNSAPIAGADGSGGDQTEYTAVPADAGKAIQCLVFVLEGGTGSVAVSRAVSIEPVSGTPPPQPPAEIAAPTPPGPATGTIETCNPGSWGGAESLSYQWYADGEPIAGATVQTYEVHAADVPGTLQCVVKGTNAATTIARASGLTQTSPAPAEAAPVATAQAAPRTTFAGASDDGRYVFFALGDGTSPGRLFRLDTQTEVAAEIAEAGIFALVSPNGSHAFFSFEEAIGEEVNEHGEEPEEGAHNLYAWNGAETRFVGRLDAADFEDQAFTGFPHMNLAAWTHAFGVDDRSGRAFAPTRSTPGGGVFVFQSHARLTAYDNEGIGEIYRYDPSAKAGERLLCASCDPSGAPPSADALLEETSFLKTTPLGRKSMVANLTDSGQEVFFQSFDRLLPEDVNEDGDVYEWTAKGSGGCNRPRGCLALISSGQGEADSYLYAMSADGHDVFIYTKEKLVGVDVAGSPSIYDARVEGGIPEPPEPAPCQGDACQGEVSEAPVLPNPATTGAGESSEVPLRRQSCAKGKHRVKGRCVKRHAKKHHRRAKRNRGPQR
jgi:sugar lactone lactonase YvrE